MNVANSSALKTHLSHSDGTATNQPGTQVISRDACNQNRQNMASVSQNSFLSPATFLIDQICSANSNALKTHFSTLYSTAAPRHPQPPLERQAQHPFMCRQTALIPRVFICPARYHPSPKPASAFVQPLNLPNSLKSAHSPGSPRNFAKLRSPHLQTHGLLKLDLVISYSVALLFDSVSCRVLLSCRCPPT